MTEDITTWNDNNEGSDFTNEMMSQMFTGKNLEFKTDLTIKEIRAISLILFLSEYLKLPEYKNFINRVMKLKVSKDRKGRKEAENILIGQNNEKNILEQKMTDLETRLMRGR
jgi:hypothetical protein